MGRGGGVTETAGNLDSIAQFDSLVKSAERVLELDRDAESSDESPYTLNDYARAGSVMLDHSDLVLIGVSGQPRATRPKLGGTRWIAQRAEDFNLPVIHIPVERPFDAELIWTDEGRREQRRIFEFGSETAKPMIFRAALDISLLGEPFDLSKTELGWIERRMVAQLDPSYNAKEWDKRWKFGSSDALVSHDLMDVPQQIDSDLKPAKAWADCRASAMAELVRGSFIVAALLAVVGVFGALLGVLFPDPTIALSGKILELACLLLIFWFIWRSRRYDWRSQWLSQRQLERHIDQVSWLSLTGRGHVHSAAPHLLKFQADNIARWSNAYFRALTRSASFPAARLTADYLKTVQALVLKNLVVDQIEYFEDEIPFHTKSDEALERWIKGCVLIAAAVTLAYVLPPVHALMERVMEETEPQRVVPVLGALLPAAAAALGAIRNHGEYAQIAARYEGACAALGVIKSQLAARLPDRRPDVVRSPMSSTSLTSVIMSTTNILFQEVHGWKAILQTKEIEPA